MTDSPAFKILRQLLPPVFKGPNFAAVLSAFASGDQIIADNAVAVRDSYFLLTASDYYLSTILGSKGFSRPNLIGISDDSYRDLWIHGFNHADTDQGILNILNIGFLDQFTHANLLSENSEPYNLSTGGNLLVTIDGTPYELTFTASSFTDSAAATALEVSSAISSICASTNIPAFAQDVLDSETNTNKVQFYTNTLGSSGSIQVNGGSAQNIISFPSSITNTQATDTQWNISNDGNVVKWEWTAGTKPPLQLIKQGYYVNVFGTEFNTLNRGTYVLTSVVNSSLTDGSGYFEYISETSFDQSVTLSAITSVMFFNPTENRVFNQKSYATVQEVIPGQTDVFMPAATDLLFRSPTTGGSFMADTVYVLNHSSTSFTEGETIIGQTSKACGYSLTSSNTSTTVSMISVTTFQAGEIILGEESQVQCTLTSSSPYFNLTVTGPFLFDPQLPETVNFTIQLNQVIYPNQSLTALTVSTTNGLADSGFFYLGINGDSEEGPIAYTGLSGDESIIIDANYKFKFYHTPNEYFNFTLQKTPTSLLDYEGIVYGAIMSDVGLAREFLQSTIEKIYPAGENLVFHVLYPRTYGTSLYSTEWIYSGNET